LMIGRTTILLEMSLLFLLVLRYFFPQIRDEPFFIAELCPQIKSAPLRSSGRMQWISMGNHLAFLRPADKPQ